MTWKEAFFASPGPRNGKAALILGLKGLLMGTADIIPGVSGGTIALITGIYGHLLAAIKSADLKALGLLLKGDFKGAAARLHLRFLLPLLLGIGTAILAFARLMSYLLRDHPIVVWSLFSGLVAASVVVVAGRISRWRLAPAAALGAGLGVAWWIVHQVPISTPETWDVIFFSGMLAICAMILPGISGAFILLILGKYAFITGTLKNPFLPANLAVIAVFGAGCLTGILLFSRILHRLLDRHHDPTMAFLTGLMAGTLPRLWPWQEAVATRLIDGQRHVIATRSALPEEMGSALLALAFFTAGAAAVLAIERLSRQRRPSPAACGDAGAD
jgi:putative membrane protein